MGVNQKAAGGSRRQPNLRNTAMLDERINRSTILADALGIETTSFAVGKVVVVHVVATCRLLSGLSQLLYNLPNINPGGLFSKRNLQTLPVRSLDDRFDFCV